MDDCNSTGGGAAETPSSTIPGTHVQSRFSMSSALTGVPTHFMSRNVQRLLSDNTAQGADEPPDLPGISDGLFSRDSLPDSRSESVTLPIHVEDGIAPMVQWGPDVDHNAKTVAILTSGGDAPGMNAAVRSCVAVCLAKNVRVYSVRNGYKGLVDGGESIEQMSWRSITNILQKGGTVIGSARCAEFRDRAGRRTAALNLVSRGVDRLVVIGGDGSLTGAELFKTEWPDLLQELVDNGDIDKDLAERHKYMCIVGMVGSIDNDMCGFSNTIGADTALHRIVDACDSLITTAESHQRTFIVEVMGRNCGYLALMAAIAVGADWVFIPERPPDVEDWESSLCEALVERRKQSNYVIVILAEGATDRVRRPIESSYLKSILSQRLGHDTRVTCLGHVQRGGSPSAADRIQGTRVGAEAALAILKADDSTPSRIVGVRYSKTIQLGLTAAVNVTKSLGKHLADRNFDEAMRLRGSNFQEMFNIFRALRHNIRVPKTGHRICLVHSGSPAAGMNAVTRTIVRTLTNLGHSVYGALDGFLGLAQGLVTELTWEKTAQWNGQGGCKLGTNRVQPDRINGEEGIVRIAACLQGYGIQALVAIGGFEAYRGVITLFNARESNPALQIPLAVVPVTISNNIPGTDFCVGSDTALNAIDDAVDRLKLSASSSRARLFIVEVMGGYCGYLAAMGALAGGADAAYIHEDIVSIEEMKKDVRFLRKKFGDNFKRAVIVRNESCSRLYKIGFMKALFQQEGMRDGETAFTVRQNVLGHLQQGNRPSPLDRVLGARLGSYCCEYLLNQIKDNIVDGKVIALGKESACLIGMSDHTNKHIPLHDLVDKSDFQHRRPNDQWFLKVQPLVRLLELNSEDKWGDDIDYEAQCIVIDDDQVVF